MLVQCKHCRKSIAVNGLGRKPLAIPVIKVYDAVHLYRDVLATANELGCSRAYIYKVLKANGLTVADVINGLTTKDTTLLNNEG